MSIATLAYSNSIISRDNFIVGCSKQTDYSCCSVSNHVLSSSLFLLVPGDKITDLLGKQMVYIPGAGTTPDHQWTVHNSHKMKRKFKRWNKSFSTTHLQTYIFEPSTDDVCKMRNPRRYNSCLITGYFDPCTHNNLHGMHAQSFINHQ